MKNLARQALEKIPSEIREALMASTLDFIKDHTQPQKIIFLALY